MLISLIYTWRQHLHKGFRENQYVPYVPWNVADTSKETEKSYKGQYSKASYKTKQGKDLGELDITWQRPEPLPGIFPFKPQS